MDLSTIDANALATAVSHIILGIIGLLNIFLHLRK